MDALRADAWIADMGDHGDFGRRYVLDPRHARSSPGCPGSPWLVVMEWRKPTGR